MTARGTDVMKRNIFKTIVTTLTVVSLTILTACGQTEKAADTASIDDSAVSRLETEVSEEHYIDDDAIALAGSSSSAEGAAMSRSALDLVNQQRAAAGLSALTWSNALESCAQVRAMECEQSFSHTRPNGTDWWTVNDAIMYGENLAYNYSDASSVVSAWMASPTHKANIMNASYTTIGIAAYQTSSGVWYWAQEFGY